MALRRTGIKPISDKKRAEIEANGPKPRAPIKRKPKVDPAVAPPPQPAKKVRPKKKTPSATTLCNKADKLAREECYRRARCEAEGHNGVQCKGRLEWAHIKSRRHRVIRHDPLNCHLLCSAHHWFYGKEPDLWTAFCEARRPGIWDYLNETIRNYDASSGPPLTEIYRGWIAHYENLRAQRKERGEE